MSNIDLLRKNDLQSLTSLWGVLQHSHSSEPIVDDVFVAQLSEQLVPDLQNLDWMHQAPASEQFCLLLQIAVFVFQKYSGDGLPLMASLAAYMNAHVPWSNGEFATICQGLDVSNYHKHKDAFVAYLKPRMVISTEPSLRSVKPTKSSVNSITSTTKNQYSKIKGLRPTLGFSPSTSSQEQQRSVWKSSPNVLTLSQAMVLLMDKEPSTNAMFSSFVLQVFEDTDPLLKTHAVFLLQNFMDSNASYVVTSGLVPLYKEELKLCMTYLPQLTAANVSRYLMENAYPCLYKLVDLEMDGGSDSKFGVDSNIYAYVEIIVSHLLGSISHISRSKEKESNELLAFFLKEISGLIQNHVHTSILICLSRLFYTLNQLITDPFIIDFEAGSLVVDAALQVQHSVLAVFAKKADPEGSALVLAYKYDLLACWAVLGKRITSFEVGTHETGKLIHDNFGLLRELAKSVPNAETELVQDKSSVLEKVPEMASLLD